METDRKEKILDLFFNEHLKQIDIAQILDVSKQYVSKILKADSRYAEAKQNKLKENTIKRKEYLTEYFKTYQRPKDEDNSYEQIVNDRITKYFAKNKIKLVDIQAINIQEYYNTLFSDGLSANTVIHHHALIRKALDYAYKMDIIPNNPDDKVQRPKKEQYIGSF